MDRSELMRAVKTVMVALSPKDDVPAFAALFFDGKWVSAFDDEIGVRTRCGLPIEGGVAGRLLSAWAGSCGGVEVTVKKSDEAGAVLECGRSKLNLSLIPTKQSPFKRPEDEGVLLDAPFDLLWALDRVSPCIGNDSLHPWRMGVTIGVSDGKGTLYATTNTLMAVASSVVDCKSLEVSLTKRFVETLLSMNKSLGLATLEFGDGWVEATFEDETTLFSKTMNEVKVESYARSVTALERLTGDMIPIPDGFEEMFARTAKVAGATKSDLVTLDVKDGLLVIREDQSEGLMSMADSVECDKAHPEISVRVNPALVTEVMKGMKTMRLVTTALVLDSGNSKAFVSVSAR